VIPGSRGSSTTSAVFLEAVRLGTAPAAVIVTQIETFLTLASIVADEMFGTPVPMVAIDQPSFQSIQNDAMVRIEPDGTITLT
jgi:predicted aconitase with swiveling domain